MNLKFLRAFWNPAFIGGAALFTLGASPLLVCGILQKFGYFPGSNLVGPGILFFLAACPAVALLIGGLVIGVRRVDATDGPPLPGRPRDDVDRVV
jgi:hypothetical protein